MTTIEEAKQTLRENWEQGIDCPCCTQLVKLWKHSINSAIARTLIKMYLISMREKREWIHIMNEIGITTMYGIAEFWGIIEPKEHTILEDDKRASGYWKLTQKGIDFVTGKILLPHYLWIFNNKVRRTSIDLISIKDCLGNKFSFIELMGFDFDNRNAQADNPQQVLF